MAKAKIKRVQKTRKNKNPKRKIRIAASAATIEDYGVVMRTPGGMGYLLQH